MKLLREMLELKAAHHNGVVIDYIEPVEQNCPMTIDQGVVICRINGYSEYVTWKYGINGSRLECNHGNYHTKLTWAVDDFDRRVREEQKNRREVA